jgi:hypothetical protein
MMLRLPHAGKHLVFVLLSLSDWVLTWAVIRNGLGHVYESNPVAAWFLHCQGWAGLALYKAAMVLTSSSLSTVISWRRPRTGGLVLSLGCGVSAAVVLYTGYLYLACAGPLDEDRNARQETVRRQEQQTRVKELLRLQEGLAEEMVAGRLGLSEAVAQLELAVREEDAPWLTGLQLFHPDHSFRQLLAIRLIHLCQVKRSGDPQAARALEERLTGEYRSLFGPSSSPPSQRQQMLV